MADFMKKMEDEVLEKMIRHDEEVIERKRNDKNEHEVQIGQDHSKFMKDLHKEEIKHNEKVMARKEEEAAKHEATIKENEQKIHGVKSSC